MKQIKWFERKFDFSYQQNIFPSIIDRLEGTALRLKHKISPLSPERLTAKVAEKWSIQENIGHLIDLEPLWQGRLADILAGATYLRAADLENKQTDGAKHNDRAIDDLVAEFIALRQVTTANLKSLDERAIYQQALHPRLEKPMRTMDLFLFVAEHDDHHLVQINQLKQIFDQ